MRPNPACYYETLMDKKEKIKAIKQWVSSHQELSLTSSARRKYAPKVIQGELGHAVAAGQTQMKLAIYHAMYLYLLA